MQESLIPANLCMQQCFPGWKVSSQVLDKKCPLHHSAYTWCHRLRRMAPIQLIICDLRCVWESDAPCLTPRSGLDGPTGWTWLLMHVLIQGPHYHHWDHVLLDCQIFNILSSLLDTVSAGLKPHIILRDMFPLTRIWGDRCVFDTLSSRLSDSKTLRLRCCFYNHVHQCQQ